MASASLPSIERRTSTVDSKQLQNDLTKMLHMAQSTSDLRERAKEVVAKFDTDKSGTFNRKEIAKCLKEMGLQLSGSELRAYTKSLLKHLDHNADDEIGFDEFFDFFQNCLADKTDRQKFLVKVQRRALSRREKAAAQNAFKAADKDGSNSIDVLEFTSIIRGMGVELSDAELQAIVEKEFNKRDKDKGGSISFEEFQKLFKHCLVSEEKKESYKKKVFLSTAEKNAATTLFEQYDADASGIIDKSEIQNILRDLGIELTTSQMKLNISQILKAGDGDGDEGLNKKEFLKFYRKCLATEGKKSAYKAKVLERYSKLNPEKAWLSGL